MPATTCPFCNAEIPLALPLPADRRVACPRCGELVPIKGVDALAVAAVVRPSAGPVSSPAPAPWTNRRLALVVLGGMAFMAAIAAGYVLKTVEFRRANDVKGVEDSTPAPPTNVPPADLAGVGYLPDDVQLIAAVRLAAMRDSEAVRVLTAQLGLTGDGRAGILGVPADDVDHLVVGASFKTLPPRLTLVLRAKRALDAEAVRAAAHAERSNAHNGKTLYGPARGPGGLDLVLWLPDNRSVVACLVKEHFDALPSPPNPYSRRFSAPLPSLLNDRLDAAALAWAVIHVEPDDATQALFLGFLPLPADERAAWGKLQDLAVSVRDEGAKLALSAQLRGRDTAATDQLGDALERSLGAAGVLSERSKDRDWVKLNATLDQDAVTKWAGRLRGGVGK